MDRERKWDIDLDSEWMTAINEEAERAFRTRVLHKNHDLASDAEALERKVVEQAKSKQICVSERTSRNRIVETLVTHLRFHPITHLGSEPVDVRDYVDRVWREQVIEMHELCKELGESWAWEYLWKNWYSPSRLMI